MNTFLSFLGGAMRAPLALMKNVMSNPMGIFVYGIISKWYIMVMLASSIVTYWVFKGLEESGVLKDAYHIVSRSLEESKLIAQHCTPKIKDLKLFWNCVESVGSMRYIPTEDEKRLYEDTEKAVNEAVNNPNGTESSSNSTQQSSQPSSSSTYQDSSTYNAPSNEPQEINEQYNPYTINPTE